MSWNLERATSLAGDILADYYLPKLGINLLSRYFALKDLDKRIDSYCQDRGGVSPEERNRLHQQLGNELKQDRWDVYRFPALPGVGWRIPFFASLNIGTKWAASWAPAGDTAFGIAYGVLPEEGVLAGWGLAGAWAMAPHIPGLKNWGRVQTGAYSQAVDRTLGTALDIKSRKPIHYDNVRCNKNDDTPSGGNRVLEGEDATEMETEESNSSVARTAHTMVCSAETAGGGPLTEESLADQIAKMYGSANPKVNLISNQTNLSTRVGGPIKILPVVNPVQGPVNIPKFTPALRPITGFRAAPAL